MITLELRKPVAKGSARRLTPIEVMKLGAFGIKANTGRNWQLERNDDGALSLRWSTRKDGAAWAIAAVPGTIRRWNPEF